MGRIHAQIEKSEYEIHWQQAAGAYMAPNRAHNLRIAFQDDGVTVTPRKLNDAQVPWVVTVRLDALGAQDFPRRASALRLGRSRKIRRRFRAMASLLATKMITRGFGKTFSFTKGRQRRAITT